MSRIVVLEVPHQVKQRGTRCEAIFFEDVDLEVYRDVNWGV